MLYNHVRRVQPQAMRKRLKPLLPAVAANKAFLPETARRLGDPLFTKNLVISKARLTRLVEHPVEFLTEILEQLDDPSRAAVALIFLNSQAGVPSPITASPALEMVTRLTGVQQAEIAKAMQHLNDSVTRLVSEADGDRWTFRHPTVTDAFATVITGSPELVELYAHGAKLDRLFSEAACQSSAAKDGRIRIPPSLYGAMVGRLANCPLDEALMSFLGARCEKLFLSQMIEARPDIMEWATTVRATSLGLGGRLLAAAMASWDLLPEDRRQQMVADIRTDSIEWLNAKPLTDKVLQQLFKNDEFTDYAEAFRKEWLSDIPSVFQSFGRYSTTGSEVGLYEEFKENMQTAQAFFELEDDDAFGELYAEIDSHIEHLEAQEPKPDSSTWSATSIEAATATSAGEAGVIFDDVDA
jgi:hypothetical protein